MISAQTSYGAVSHARCKRLLTAKTFRHSGGQRMGRIAPICVIRRPLHVRLRWVDFCRSRYARPVIRMASMRFFESAGAPSTSLFAITMSHVAVIDATRRPRNLLGQTLIVPSEFRCAPRACISPTGRAERIRWRKALRFLPYTLRSPTGNPDACLLAPSSRMIQTSRPRPGRQATVAIRKNGIQPS